MRYPIVELAGLLSFVGVLFWWLQSGAAESVASVVVGLVAFLYLAAISIALALIDLDVFRLPNLIVLPAYPVLIALLGTASLIEGDISSFLRAAVGGSALFLVYFAIVVAYPGGMGFGDVKLAGVLGFATAWLGWGQLAVGALAPFLLGGAFGVILLIAKRAGRKSSIPFGPWMLVGAWVGIIAGEIVADWYLALFSLT